MKRIELQVKSLYEKPECNVISAHPFAIMAGSPRPEAGFEVDPWEETESENPGGTSEGADDLPDWLKP